MTYEVWRTAPRRLVAVTAAPDRRGSTCLTPTRTSLTEWWEPWHRGCEYDVPLGTRRFWWPMRRTGRTCDLPAEPVRQREERRSWRARKVIRCQWEPITDTRPFHHPHRDDIHGEWSGPDRAGSRDECRRAISEFRATGTVDTIPRTNQHRHSVGWWW